jgi:hypothetical protein
LELKKFGPESKNETMGCKEDILTLLVTLFFNCKVLKIFFEILNLLLSFEIKWNL